MTFLRIVLAFAGLLASLSFSQAKITVHNNNSYLKSCLLSNQLIINSPLINSNLTANTTSYVNVTSNPPTVGLIEVTTTFDCTSGIFTVTSEINDYTAFEVPPSASGNCSVSASAPLYITSSTVTVFIDVPLYYEYFGYFSSEGYFIEDSNRLEPSVLHPHRNTQQRSPRYKVCISASGATKNPPSLF